MVRHWFSRSARLIPVAALLLALLALVVAVGPVAAATPTVTTDPAIVAFGETPGLPGYTQLTFAANGTVGLVACGQDNSVLPTFKLGAVDPAAPLSIPFHFIQAGTYTFWLSADPTCAVGSKLTAGGTPVQAQAKRAGPTGKVGADDIAFLSLAPNLVVGGPASLDLLLLGGPPPTPQGQQTFPIDGVQLCIMSGDGAQVAVAMKVGQDTRPEGLGAAAATTTVMPIAGQNGCFPVPWVVNGGYTASIARSGTATSLGFCVAGKNVFEGKTLFDPNTPSNTPTASGIGKCAQVAFFPSPNNGSFPAGRTLVNGAIVTGAVNHAVQVCVSAFSPDRNPGRFTVPFLELANQVNAYNQSGAVNLTPLDIGFPSHTVVKITTYDITGPGPGGAGGAQFVCPPTTATQQGDAITAITAPDVPGATIIDTKNYFRS